jgi:pSer/pThr/pTyr-binding forkhead associated (FHA) protein
MTMRIDLADLIEATHGSTAKQFVAACPYPVLLLLREGPKFGARLEFDHDRSERAGLTIGRVSRLAETPLIELQFLVPNEPVVVGSEGTVQIYDRSVSKRHAEFTLTKGLWRLKDLESRRGTTLEGRRISPGIAVPIVDGHHVRFGLAEAVFLEPRSLYRLMTLVCHQGAERLQIPPEGVLLKELVEEAAESTAPGPESGPFLVQIPQTNSEGRTAGTFMAGATQACGESAILGSRRSKTFDQARVHSLSAATPMVIGRGTDCDLVLAESSASRRHAQLLRQGDRVRVTDLNSGNGTFVDGERLPAGVTATLDLGDTLRFAGYTCMILGYEQLQELFSVVHRSQPTAA